MKSSGCWRKNHIHRVNSPMVEVSRRIASLSPAKRRLLEQRLKKRPDVVEPIAVVGMACRFPGAPNLDSFWQLIDNAIDATGEIPNTRWNVDALFDPTGEQKGKMSTRWAGLIDDPDLFDPMFFGIAPREAARMDPQQRLLLEVAWEALEHGGLASEKMNGSATGVFIGIGGNDYSKIPAQYENYFEHIDAHSGTGNALSIAANRLSYVFDFRGPSLSVDTACSSGLVGLHLAIQALRSRECDAALAGGVNMILSPETTIAFSHARMLSPDGHCRPFDAGANGYVRGEGCGMIVLKRLTDANRDRDNILAVIRASAVNQDGRTSGITAPNALSQQRVIRAALAQAGLTADRITYIEAHGTGTPLGDPMEVQALGEVFRRNSPDDPLCHVTSIKANVGHMETVSGIAGLIKVVLMLQKTKIPAQAHLKNLNPNIQLDGTRLHIPTEATVWSSHGLSRMAGVSSFGFGGANAHIIVEEAAPLPTGTLQQDRPLHVLALSAKTESALSKIAQNYSGFLQEQRGLSVSDVCHSANVGRTHFNHRLTITAEDRPQMLARLDAAANEKRTAGVKRSQVKIATRPKIAMVFTGQGSQYVGMGRTLFESHPQFRQTLEKLDETFREVVGPSLLTVLYPESDEDSRLHETAYTQPALFVLEYALAQLWRAWGVEPSIVLGHSVGEYVACSLAGVFRPEDGLRLIAQRARLMQKLPRNGKMAVLFTSPERVAATIAHLDDSVNIAAANGPENTVLSGTSRVVEQVVEKFRLEGVESKCLAVSHAFHSPLMDPMLDNFEEIAGTFQFDRPHIPIASNLTGEILDAEAPDARYWRHHVRKTVRFSDGMQRLAEHDLDAILEVGPTASLLGMGRRCVPGLDVAWLPSLRQGQSDWHVLLDSLSALYVMGVKIDWDEFDAHWPRLRPSLPNYPFERTRHWHNESGKARSGLFTGRRGLSLHPLLGSRVVTALDSTVFESSIRCRTPQYLVDHQVQGSVVTPAASYLEQALAAADQIFGHGNHVLQRVAIQQAMFLPDEACQLVQLTVSPGMGGQRAFEIYSTAEDNEENSPHWTLHACGTLCPAADNEVDSPERIDLEEFRSRVVTTTDRDLFYDEMAERGLAYGPAFRVLHQLQRTDRDALAEVRLNEVVLSEANQYRMHPALLDACFQSMAGVIPLEANGSHSPYTYMPVGVRSVRMVRPLTENMLTYVVRQPEGDRPSPETVEGDVFLLDENGEVLVELAGIRIQRLGRSPLLDQKSDFRDWLYQLQWTSQPLPNKNDEKKDGGKSIPDVWLIFGDDGGVGDALATQIKQGGGQPLIISPADRFSRIKGHDDQCERYTLRSLHGEDYHRLLAEVTDSANGVTCAGVVHLWSLNVIADDDAARSAPEMSRRMGCGSVLQLIQQLARFGVAQPPALWLVTQGAQAVAPDEGVSAVFQSPLWGMGRVSAMEHPELKCRLIDLERREDVEAASIQLAKELLTATDEDQIALRRSGRCVARLQRTREIIPDVNLRPAGKIIPANSPFQLRLGAPGSFDSLRFESAVRPRPTAGQVEIQVHAAGLNFSDVLKAMGLYPGIQDQIVPLGIECSGVVTARGADVTRFQVGDEVMGVAPYSFASHATSAEYALVPKPQNIDHEQAATIPITFLTAYYALHELAHLSRHERILIHAAAGGVGLAAIQIAQQIGAEIFATAGSDEKRDYLRSLGVEHVMNSRTLEFAGHIMDVTHREGVDVVLNSLPGDAITKSLESMRAYGRFLEIGKTDIYQNRMIGLLPFQDNLSYFAIDLDRMLRQRPDYIRDMFSLIVKLFEAETYKPLAFTQFAVEDTVDAFRYMAQRKNIGKVVLSLEEQDLAQQSDNELNTSLVREDGTYLITGGLGALGLRVADWLAKQGAGHVALLSRRPPTDSVINRIDSIREQGTKVATLQGDVSQFESVVEAIANIPPSYPPLRGVIHAAGILEDGVLFDMDLDRLDRVLAPKLAGAWNLHRATLDQPIDLFVCFSSMAAVLGSPGQGNYAAGNAFLDGLASYRRSQGLPATSINWGPWAQSGMAAEAGRGAQIKSRGVEMLPPDQSLMVLGDALQHEVTNLVVMDVQWSDMLRLMTGRRPPLLGNMIGESDTYADESTGADVDHEFRAKLLVSGENERIAKLGAYFADELANIMGIDATDLNLEQPLSNLGLDSLMAMELKNKLESRLILNIPMARFLEGPSVNKLAAVAAELIGDGSEASVSVDIAQAGPAETDWSPLLPLQREGKSDPLFFIHPAGGDVRCYLEVARKLGNQRPIYVLRARGIEHSIPPHHSIPEMAADYLAAMDKIKGKGPYHLAGWSTGGIYAYEIAHQITKQNGELGTLIFIDSPTPAIFSKVDLADEARFLFDLVNFSNYFAGADMVVSYDDLRRQQPEQRIQTVLSEAVKHKVFPPDVSADHIRRLIDVCRAHSRAIMDYKPPKSGHEVHIFRPGDVSVLMEASSQKLTADLGWNQYLTNRFNFYQIPGDHFSMMTGDNAARLARLINECIGNDELERIRIVEEVASGEWQMAGGEV